MRTTNNQSISQFSRCLCLTLLLVSGTTLAESFEISACLRQDYNPAVVTEYGLTLPDKVPLTAQCWLTVEQLRQQQALEPVTLVDVRPAGIQRLAIDEALPMALSRLKDSVTLKNQRVILVGDGYDRLALDSTCVALKQNGFENVSALLGGAPALLREQRNHSLNTEINQISAQQLWIGSLAISWQLVTIDLAPEQIALLPQLSAERINTADSTTPNQLAALSARLIDITTSVNSISEMAEPTPLVLIAADTPTTQILQKAWADSLPPGTLWLSGGMRAYEDYIQQQQQISASFGRGLMSSCG